MPGSKTTLLSGKVVKHTLPIFNGTTGPDAPRLKRLLLPQGELTSIHDADEGVHYIAFIELREGGARGNHFHKIKKEMVYLIQGEVLLVVEDTETKTRESVPLQAGDVATIPVGVAHVLRTVKPGHAIEFSAARFDPSDTYRYPLS
jgi:mannose-6-phosphate isomerase-like protein (cupin superfamily)